MLQETAGVGLDIDPDHFTDIPERSLNLTKICDLDPQKTRICGSLPTDI